MPGVSAHNEPGPETRGPAEPAHDPVSELSARLDQLMSPTGSQEAIEALFATEGMMPFIAGSQDAGLIHQGCQAAMSLPWETAQVVCPQVLTADALGTIARGSAVHIHQALGILNALGPEHRIHGVPHLLGEDVALITVAASGQPGMVQAALEAASVLLDEASWERAASRLVTPETLRSAMASDEIPVVCALASAARGLEPSRRVEAIRQIADWPDMLEKVASSGTIAERVDMAEALTWDPEGCAGALRRLWTPEAILAIVEGSGSKDICKALTVAIGLPVELRAEFMPSLLAPSARATVVQGRFLHEMCDLLRAAECVPDDLRRAVLEEVLRGGTARRAEMTGNPAVQAPFRAAVAYMDMPQPRRHFREFMGEQPASAAPRQSPGPAGPAP